MLRLIAAEVSRRGVSYGTHADGASLSYNANRQTLTVTVNARGVTPGPHATIRFRPLMCADIHSRGGSTSSPARG